MKKDLTDLADNLYIDEAIKKVDAHNDFIDSFVYGLQAIHHSHIEKFIEDILSTKVFPKIWGKPNKFSLWWRRIKIERNSLSTYEERVIIKQFGKVVADKLINLANIS